MNGADKELPERVRDIRTGMGLTQPEFAELAGVKYRAYQNFENAASRPQPANLRKILRAAGIEPGDEGKGGDPETDGPIDYFLEVVKIWLTNMDQERRSRVIREMTRRIVSGDFLETEVSHSSMTRG